MLTILLATATASEELPDELGFIALACFLMAFCLALIAALTRLFSRSQTQASAWMAATALLLGILPVVFVAYVHHIDFVPQAADGTPASGPLWRALWVPCLPMIISAVVLMVRKRAAPARDV